MPAPIRVDDAYLSRAAVVHRTIQQDAPASPDGSIDNLTVKPGHSSFTLAANMASAIQARGKEVKQRLDEIGLTAGTRAQDLDIYMALTDGTDGLNNVTATKFMQDVPSWSTTKSGATSSK